MIILGIDPGTATTGFAIIEAKGAFRVLDYGVISTKAGKPISLRLQEIYEGICELIEEYKPNTASVESLFFCNNLKTATAVGQARGVVMLACQQHGLDFFEYTPKQVKQAVVGYGMADKKQVQFMVQRLYQLKELPRPDDAADALALCYCHGMNFSLNNNLCKRSDL